MAIAIIGASIALKIAAGVAIALAAGGATTLASKGLQDLAAEIGKSKRAKETAEEWERMQQETQAKIEKLQKAQDKDSNYQADLALMDALGLQKSPNGIDLTREKKIELNPLQEEKWDFSQDKTLAESLGVVQNGSNNTNGNNEKEEEKGKDPILMPGNGNSGIQDTTTDNIENNISGVSSVDEWKKWAEEQQQKLWAREDAIRKETQQREDTAWQRSVEDMKKAGINPNLVNAQPAESGGGITQATQMDMSTIANQMDIDSEKIQQLIDQAFEGRENEKKQFMDIFGNLLQTIVFAFVMRGKGG